MKKPPRGWAAGRCASAAAGLAGLRHAALDRTRAFGAVAVDGGAE